MALAREALALDPHCVEALDHLASILVTRQRRYEEGLALIERATTLRPDDAGLWYTHGWLHEFAAHEIKRRRPAGIDLEVRALYETAALSFRRCLDLRPEGKLIGDAEDLLDHVENELLSL
ncbi:MAG: hypothetical protein HY873_02500 [Chloroflexi bacterium]|nr:hypothetical protein [Chloroflexota bacterium]